MGSTLYSFSDKTMGKCNLQAQTQNGRISAWHKYIMAQIFKKALWYHTADKLLQEIQRQFGDTDK